MSAAGLAAARAALAAVTAAPVSSTGLRSPEESGAANKFNPNHDERGRFASADAGGLSPATYTMPLNANGSSVVDAGQDYERFISLAEKAVGSPAYPADSGPAGPRFSQDQRATLKGIVARTVGAIRDKRVPIGPWGPHIDPATGATVMGTRRTTGVKSAGEIAIERLNNQWAETSGDHNPQSIMVQRAAAEQFNLKGAASPDAIYHLSDNPEYGEDPFYTEGHFDRAYAAQADGLKASLQATYDNTQAYLKANGIDSLTVYRGVALDRAPVAEVQTNPLSSWSLDAGTAWSFSQDTSTNQKDYVYAAKVPASRIMSLPMTGMGCLTESEVVLLGGTDKVNVYRGDGTPVLEYPTATKAERVINIDADLHNADWPKRTPDRMSDLVVTSPEAASMIDAKPSGGSQ